MMQSGDDVSPARGAELRPRPARLVRVVLAAASCAMLLAMPPVAAQAAEPAKQLFGAKALPADMAARAIGSYARGCMAGGRALAVTGDAWQVMRLERNRNWGQPVLIDYLETLARDARDLDGWPGLLVGDLAQPRGGPMLTGHASHQIGLDADIWLRPMPERELSFKERSEEAGLSALSMLAADMIHADPQKFMPGQMRLIRRAASYPQVARIFLHPGLKKALCAWEKGDRSWLSKVRPWWGHHYHFHVRLACPAGSSECENQPPPGAGDGCGREIDEWIAMISRPAPKPEPGSKPKPKKEMTMAALPNGCRDVLAAADLAGRPMAASPGPAPAASSLTTASMPAVPMPSPRPAAR